MTSDATNVKASSELATLRRELEEEQTSLEHVLEQAGDDEWLLATPSTGWSVADQIGHLTYFDASAATAILDPVAFVTSVDELVSRATRQGIDEYTLSPFRALSAKEQFASWQRARQGLAAAAARLSDETRVPWYGPSMSAKSFLSARLMETWAHGHDVVEALHQERAPTIRLRHVAQLGYLTRNWSYRVRGEAPPEGAIRLELVAPGGDVWIWGPADAHDRVKGSAEEFCLVVTQRRHVDDTSIVTGELGRHWLERAQAFAGGPSDGPRPRSTA